MVFKRRHIVEFCLGLYHARTGQYKQGKSRLGPKIQKFFAELYNKRVLTKSMIAEYGLGGWLKQECAFGDMCGDTDLEFTSFQKLFLEQ
jgi:hypothetical protein